MCLVLVAQPVGVVIFIPGVLLVEVLLLLLVLLPGKRVEQPAVVRPATDVKRRGRERENERRDKAGLLSNLKNRARPQSRPEALFYRACSGALARTFCAKTRRKSLFRGRPRTSGGRPRDLNTGLARPTCAPVDSRSAAVPIPRSDVEAECCVDPQPGRQRERQQALVLLVPHDANLEQRGGDRGGQGRQSNGAGRARRPSTSERDADPHHGERDRPGCKQQDVLVVVGNTWSVKAHT